MSKTYRKHGPDRRTPYDRRHKAMKSHKQQRPNERAALRKEYR